MNRLPKQSERRSRRGPSTWRSRWSKKVGLKRGSPGQSLVLVGLMLVALIGMLALVMDGGFAYMRRRAAQVAADAGALAGARELCVTGDPALAVDAAIDYTVNRNDALEVDVTISDGVVTVVARNPFATFFGRVFGVTTVTTGAVAEAECLVPGGGAEILPIAWSCPPDETVIIDGQESCDVIYEKPYIIMNSKKIDEDGAYCISEGGTVDCDIDDDGYDDLIAGGDRSWLDLNGDGADLGTGSSELVYWIENGYPGTVSIHTWFGGQPGVSTNVFMAVYDIVGEPQLLPVYNAVHTGVPPIPWDHPDDQVVISSGNTTYYHVISFSIFVPTCVHAKGGDSCPLYDAFRADGTLDPNDKTIEGYFIEGTLDGLTGKGGEVYAGAYTIYLTR